MPSTEPTQGNVYGRILIEAWRHDGLTRNDVLRLLQGPCEPLDGLNPSDLRRTIEKRRSERQRLSRRAGEMLARLAGWGHLQHYAEARYELADDALSTLMRRKDTHRARAVAALARESLTLLELTWAMGQGDNARPPKWYPSGHRKRLIRQMLDDGEIRRAQKLTDKGHSLVSKWLGPRVHLRVLEGGRAAA